MFDENLEKLVDLFENKILQAYDKIDIESIAKKYESLDHPQIGYRIGEKYLIVDRKENALPYLIKSSIYGLDPYNPYLTTGYANSVGQSMWYILKYFDFNKKFEPYEYKIYCTAFMILSITINELGIGAYDSLRTRAMMIGNLNKPCIKKMLSKYYYDGENLCTEILSFADYYQAFIGLSNVGQNQNAQDCRKWAQENKETMISLPQYTAMSSFSEQIILKISQENQIHLLKNMLQDYKDGVFKLSKFEFEDAIDSYRIKPFLGLESLI